MNENVKALLTRIAESEELQAKFAELDTPEKAYEFAKSLQDGFTQEEFLDAVAALNEADEGDISDEALAAAAGGTGEALTVSEAPKVMSSGMATGGRTIFAPGASPKYRNTIKKPGAILKVPAEGD